MKLHIVSEKRFVVAISGTDTKSVLSPSGNYIHSMDVVEGQMVGIRKSFAPITAVLRDGPWEATKSAKEAVLCHAGNLVTW